MIRRMKKYEKKPLPLYTDDGHMRYYHSLSSSKRTKEIKKTEEENLKIYKRILKQTATLNVKKYLDDYFNGHQVQRNGGYRRGTSLRNLNKVNTSTSRPHSIIKFI